MKFFLAFLAQLIFVLHLGAQSYNGAYLSSDLRISGKLVLSQLMTEMQSDFSGGVNEFNNKPGAGFAVEFSKQLSLHWDIGAEIILSTLKGEALSPDFSAIGYHGAMMEPLTAPVVYKSQLFGKKVFVQYNFIVEEYQNATNPFIRFGVGVLPYRSELRYKDDWDGLIFGKGVEEYEKNKVSTALYTLTPGIRTKISGGLEFTAALNLNMVNYDFLDVVHNYSEEGERMQMKGIYADFMAGITILINNSGRFDVLTKKRGKKGKAKDTLPFYKRR